MQPSQGLVLVCLWLALWRTDPIALDQACLDTIENTMGRKYFKRGRHALSYGETLGLGSMTYELVTTG